MGDDMEENKMIKDMLNKSNGMIETAQVVAAGISKQVFYQYVRTNNLHQVSHGVYAEEDAWIDFMYLLHLRCEQAVFSHETALFFHDLTDREPMQYSITVGRGYHTSLLKADGIQVYTIKKELHDLGLSSAETPFGNIVPVYDMERTICDILRNRKNIEMQTFQGAVKMYVRRKDKDLRKLIQYSQKLRVEKVLRQYLEVLL